VRLSIRSKLALLAGIPVLGAAILAFSIVQTAREDARKAEALGSIESLAELSHRTTNLVHALQTERAALSLALGKAGPKGRLQAPSAVQKTDEALRALSEFLAQRDESKLPQRLSLALQEARRHLEELSTFRARAARGETALEEIDNFYARGIRSLIKAVAGLTDLSDDGELLRLLNALAVALELEERMSQEHALLSDVFAERRFPPGSYRKLVALISEQDIYTSVYRTSAALPSLKLFERRMSGVVVEKSLAMRKLALETDEEELRASADEWYWLGEQKLELLRGVERTLNEESRSVALQKLDKTRRSVSFSVALAAGVILVSLTLAWVIAYSITRKVERLRDASQRVAAGDLEARVSVASTDELGELGLSFNDMVGRLHQAQVALSDQARMARELEIAAALQRAMLPPAPRHAEFEFAGRMRPADEVGGDFYDVLTREDAEDLWITIGDVSGHGVGAGLVMLMAQSAFASHFLDDPKANPERVLRAVNTLLCENIQTRLRDDKYVTAQLLVRSGAGRFSCVGAHEWPLIYRAATKECETLETPGPWLGIESDLPEVPVTSLELGPGDVLCLYSDGVTEAQNQQGELFDVDRMRAALAQSLGSGATLDRAIADVFESVERFSGRHDDDWTMLLVRRAA
jgi:serine phosphatase RsbU (regulator of sigma subunit)